MKGEMQGVSCNIQCLNCMHPVVFVLWYFNNLQIQLHKNNNLSYYFINLCFRRLLVEYSIDLRLVSDEHI